MKKSNNNNEINSFNKNMIELEKKFMPMRRQRGYEDDECLNKNLVSKQNNKKRVFEKRHRLENEEFDNKPEKRFRIETEIYLKDCLEFEKAEKERIEMERLIKHYISLWYI